MIFNETSCAVADPRQSTLARILGAMTDAVAIESYVVVKLSGDVEHADRGPRRIWG